MGKPTMEDIAQDMHDQELHEQALMELSPDQEKAFAQAFGNAAANANATERLNYLVWLSKHLDEAEDLNKSASRVTICLALAGMPNYEVNDERDAGKNLPVGTEMLDAIMPPATDDTWGSYGRPTSFFHQIFRMGGQVKSGKNKGKPMHLIKTLLGPDGQLKMGNLIIGFKLDSTGMCYAHMHSKGKITKDDLFDYWSHVAHGREIPDATNPAYLALTGQGPVVDDSPNQWQTPGAYAWKDSLGLLESDDDTVPERYKAVSPMKLSKALIAVHTKDAVECLKFLDKADQQFLFNDVMKRSKVGASKYARAKIMGDLTAAKTYAAKIEVLVAVYGSEHQSGPDATTVIEELICRCAWAVVSRVMGYRLGEAPAGREVDMATELMNHARTLEHLEALQQMVGDVAARIGATASGYEGEYEINKPTPRIH